MVTSKKCCKLARPLKSSFSCLPQATCLSGTHIYGKDEERCQDYGPRAAHSYLHGENPAAECPQRTY